MKKTLASRAIALALGLATSLAGTLAAGTLRGYVAAFNADDEELYTNAVPNAAAADFLERNVPVFACPDADIERTYYFRWWTYRKHLRKTERGWVVTEFLPDVGWAGKYNTIACPFGHHLREGRWLREASSCLDDYTRIMLAEGNINGPRAYVNGPAWATLERAKVTGDFAFAERCLKGFVRNYEAWERGWPVRGLSLRDTKSARSYAGPQVRVGFRAERGLFDCAGDREGSEFALSLDGARPMVNAVLWAEAVSIAELAGRVGDTALRTRFARKADGLERNIRARLWNPDVGFFVSLGVDGTRDTVKELHGYAPFYYGLPLGAAYAVAWKPLVDPLGFLAPRGLTFPAQDAPGFARTPDPEAHECLWNGPSWPYATSVALTALYGQLQRVDGVRPAGASSDDFVRLLHLYAAQHRRLREDGRTVAWIDEDCDAFTGEWIARKILIEKARRCVKPVQHHERGKDYNHSTFCDLVIAGLCGIVPQKGDTVAVRPLAPADWDWFRLAGVRYHGHDLDVVWDRTGAKFGRGRGLSVWVDGAEIARAAALGPLEGLSVK